MVRGRHRDPAHWDAFPGRLNSTLFWDAPRVWLKQSGEETGSHLDRVGSAKSHSMLQRLACLT